MRKILQRSSLQYLRLADLPDNAVAVWEKAAKRYKSSYLAWTCYTDLLMFVSPVPISDAPRLILVI
jgi:hypothetical protein